MSDSVVCSNCHAFAAECETPIGDGAELLCWLCAHDVVFHEMPMGTLREGACGCKREDVYPAHVIAKMDADRAAAGRYSERPAFIGRDSDRLVEARRERVARVQLHRTGEHATHH